MNKWQKFKEYLQELVENIVDKWTDMADKITKYLDHNDEGDDM